jgi:hypothetical protein
MLRMLVTGLIMMEIQLIMNVKNVKNLRRVIFVDISVGDRVEMKKQHPCGCKTFEILRVGMDFKIKCEKCGREVMAPRAKIEKNIKKILTE